MKNSLFRIDKNSIVAQESRMAGIVVLPRLEEMMLKSETEQKAQTVLEEEPENSENVKNPLEIELELKRRQLAALNEQIEQAKNQTEKLLQEAAQTAKRLKEQALQDGYRCGIEKAGNEIKARKDKDKKDLSDMMQAFSRAQDTIYQQMEESVLDLAVYIAEYILKTEIQDDGNVFKNLVMNTLVTLKNQSKIIVKISKNEYDRFFSDAEDSMVNELKNTGIQIIMDISLQSGDCLVETDYGFVNLGVKTQLNRLEYALKQNWTKN